jgi:hypothetical protein
MFAGFSSEGFYSPTSLNDNCLLNRAPGCLGLPGFGMRNARLAMTSVRRNGFREHAFIARPHDQSEESATF